MNFIAYILKDRPLDPVVDPDVVCLLAPGVAHRGGGSVTETNPVIPSAGQQRAPSPEY